ncbi:nucleotide-binding universal stress UspA family protein [Silvibacterium bohemicum]|uniref:Nucleotide-binding universal stress UspA family protein n=1 Tax=Silvibacterium bohemicum TaxID=1577686 RepID=A0A841JPY1_9BACT|nr:universal stress protein [Silvibacterium bohemicum]MBB6143200.1 nucleotide-binding universal stress UspA family protein [Silvibacterium bohemicum]
MYKKIVVAFNESPESRRALKSAVQLATSLGAELDSVTVMGDLPAYTSFIPAADPGVVRLLDDARLEFYEQIQQEAHALAASSGIELRSHFLDGRQVGAIVEFLRSHNVDLLVIGLHQRDLHISRLWSTVYDLAQEAPCSVLGVH